MLETLNEEPDRFFYFNNGITIVCDRAEKMTARGRDVLRVSNPQVINGQQTTRTLASSIKKAARAAVLVKVICVPREHRPNEDEYDELGSQIVAGTNWQTAITPSDLMANDRRQIELEGALRNRGYLYLRKRQTKGEARRHGGGKNYLLIKKEELAQAVAGCDLDPIIIRSGREKLFEEERYTTVFPNSDPLYYLPRYWLFREVTSWSKGVPARGYAKWMVLNFIWSELSEFLRRPRTVQVFVKACEPRQDKKITDPLGRAINTVFKEALRYYRKNRGAGEAQLDISIFFKNRKNHHRMFEKYWTSISKASDKSFRKNLQRVQKAFEELAT
jgi:hypothetical protein